MVCKRCRRLRKGRHLVLKHRHGERRRRRQLEERNAIEGRIRRQCGRSATSIAAAHSGEDAARALFISSDSNGGISSESNAPNSEPAERAERGARIVAA